MATKYWTGGAAAVAQVATATFATYDVATTRTITIGGVGIGAADSGGTLTAALAALAALLNASTHPYFSTITWSSNATQIIGTADTPGVPFIFAGSATGGTGTCTDAFTVSTANAGPTNWSTALNWSDGAVPGAADTVIFADDDTNVAFGLDQNSLSLTKIIIEQSFTGNIGLPYNAFTTSADGNTSNASYREYREDYLKLQVTTIEVGGYTGVSVPAGSGRIKINNTKSAASTLTVYRTASVSSDSGKAALRYLAAHASADVYVREGKGGVAIAADEPNETSTVGKVSVSATDGTTRAIIGSGVTLTTFEQQGGNNILNAAATITTVEVNGGTLTIEGDYTITALNVNGGTVYDNHIKTGGNAVTTATQTGGQIDLTRSSAPRTIATLNPDGGTLITDDGYITITTLDKPSGPVTMTVS